MLAAGNGPAVQFARLLPSALGANGWRVIEIKGELGPDPRSSELVDGLICECSDPGCLERVGPLTISEYEAVRGDPRRFIIAANHQALDVESVLEMNPAYWVVEKREGVPAEVARERDPRG